MTISCEANLKYQLWFLQFIIYSIYSSIINKKYFIGSNLDY